MQKITRNYMLLLATFLVSLSGYSQVDVVDNLFSETPAGVVYENTTYNITTVDVNDLTNVVPLGVDFLNVYYNDGTNNLSYALHGVAGKTLQAIFGGENTEMQAVDITQLRSDWYEWFKVGGTDGRVTLVNCNAIARTIQAPTDNVIVTEPLYNTGSTGTQYKTTAYQVKDVASMTDLASFTIGATKDWVNIYVKTTIGSADPYERIDIFGVAGMTLEQVLINNNIAIEDLYQFYFEWFQLVDNSNTLIKCNIKAVEELGSSLLAIYPNLFSNGGVETYQHTGYKINITAAAGHTDLDEMILVADADFVNIYLADGTRIDVAITADISINAILAAAGVIPSQLEDQYLEWFMFDENADGTREPVLRNINFKASKITGALPPVTQTLDLFSSGSFEYQNIAYFVRSNATQADMNAYTLTGDSGLNIYYRDANDNTNQTLNIAGTQGQLMGDAVVAALGSVGASIGSLRTDYVEWFKDINGDLVLVNLSVKEKTLLPDAIKIIVTPNLFSKSGTTEFENVAYLGKSSAVGADYAAITLAANVEYINVYTTDVANPNAIEGRFTLHGVGGKDLQTIFAGGVNGSTEGYVIDITTLRQNYVEWFRDGSATGSPTLVRMNVKSVITSVLSIGANNMTLDAAVYPNPMTDNIRVSIPAGLSFEYVIYSVSGAVILTGDSSISETDIDVSELSHGVYILHVKSGDTAFTSKLIK